MKMKSLLITAALALVAGPLFADPTDGQILIPIYNGLTGTTTEHWVTPQNSKAIGINSSGVPAMLSLGSGGDLGTLSDVALTGLAANDFLIYNAGTSKWNNLARSSLSLAYTQITGLGTLATQNGTITDYLTTASAASTYGAVASPLSQFASTTSAQLRGVLSDESGTGVFLTANGSGASLTSLTASNISSGTLADGRLSSNVPLKDGINAFTNASTITNSSAIGLSIENTSAVSGTALVVNNTDPTGSPILDVRSGGVSVLSASDSAITLSRNLLTTAALVVEAPAYVNSLHLPDGGGYFTAFQAQTQAGNVVYTMPAADGTSGQVLSTNGSGVWSWITSSGTGDALVANPLSQFAATTSAQLRGVLSDESGTGVFLTANGDGASLTNVTHAADWDTIGEIETAIGGGNIILATEIDTSAQLRAILSDESGTGVFLTANGDGASLTNVTKEAFKTITVSGQSDIVADTATDTLTLVAGAGIAVTTNAGTDTATIASAAIPPIIAPADVVNNNATPNTLADFTGLSYAVSSGVRYHIRVFAFYNSAATATGSRFVVDGPASFSQLNGKSYFTLAATTETTNNFGAWNIPAACNASSLTTGNVAEIEFVVTPSSSGTIQVKFASEVASSAITALAGSFMVVTILP